MDADPQCGVQSTPTTSLVASSVSVALAASEGVDLRSLALALALPPAQRPVSTGITDSSSAPRLLDLSGALPSGFSSPQPARRYRRIA